MGEREGILFVISGPSGVGKGTILEQVLKEVDSITFSVSATTRPPRPNEKHGTHYFFITEEEFRRKAERGDFLEWAKVHNAYYGTPKDPVDQSLEKGKDVLLDIDVQGAMSVQKAAPHAVAVFVAPPSVEELKKRLKRRETESEADMAVRLREAQSEQQYVHHYDYLVINDSLPETVEEVKSIIIAERCRRLRRLKEVWNEDAHSIYR